MNTTTISKNSEFNQKFKFKNLQHVRINRDKNRSHRESIQWNDSKNFPNIEKEMDTGMQDVFSTSNKHGQIRISL